MAIGPGIARGDLSGSWAPIDAGAESVELSSEDESTLRLRQRSSRNQEGSDQAARGTGVTGNGRASQTLRTEQTSTQRKRVTASVRHLDQSPVVMPKLEHTSSQDSGTPLAKRPVGRKTKRDLGTSPSPVQSRRRLARSKVEREGSVLDVVWHNLLSPSLSYLMSIAGITLSFAKPLIAYGLAVYLLVGLLIMARNLVFSSVTTALTPICNIPGSSYILPFCATANLTAKQHGDPEFANLITTQAAFEDILTNSAESASLPMDMKRSEASIRDLRHVVEFSGLPSRNELVFEFAGFIETARQASGDLTRYNSRIGRAVDRILSTNRWTLQVLDSIASSYTPPGSLSRVASSLNIFAPFLPASRTEQDQLFERYMQHTTEVEAQIQALIVESQALLLVLQNLDDRLDVIASVASRDDDNLRASKDELFATLWTKLGGNRATVARMQRQLGVLREVSNYRNQAVAHVGTTLVKLQTIAAALEDLRERVAKPEILGVDGAKGAGAVPLDVHVSVILMGVERLEEVRESGRKIESARIRGILDREARLGVDAGAGPSRLTT